MPRRQQAYDLNRQVRLLDIHRQFMGGLKTIDTDDALGSAYLRDVDNLSISEFGFLEKRYGTFVNDEIQFADNVPLTGIVQGYFEYIDEDGDTHKIIFVDGIAYIKNPKDEADPHLFKKVDVYHSEEGFDYPLASIIDPNWTQVNIVVTFDSAGGSFVPPQFGFESLVVQEPDPPTREKFQFDGWELDGTLITDFSELTVTESVTITAVWTEIITVVFDDLQGSYTAPESQSGTTPFTATEPDEPTRVGFVFSKWQLDGVDFDFNIPLTEDIVLTPVWRRILPVPINLVLTDATTTKLETVSIENYFPLQVELIDETKVEVFVSDNNFESLPEIITRFRLINSTIGQPPFPPPTPFYDLGTNTTEEIVDYTVEIKNSDLIGFEGYLEPKQNYRFSAFNTTTLQDDFADSAISTLSNQIITKGQLLSPTVASDVAGLNSIQVVFNNPNNENVSIDGFLVDETNVPVPNTNFAFGNVPANGTYQANFSNLSPETQYKAFSRVSPLTGSSNIQSLPTVTTPIQTLDLIIATFISFDNIVYDSQSGSAPLSIVVPQDPIREGFVFDGWDPEVPATINESATFTAQWIERTTIPEFTNIEKFAIGTIRFRVRNLDSANAQLLYKETTPGRETNFITIGTNVANNGLSDVVEFTNLPQGTYTFEAFAIADNKVSSGVTNLSITLEEVFTATFDPNGGTWADETTTSKTADFFSGSTVPDPRTNIGLSRSGFTFEGWSPALPSTITANTTYVAQWEEIPPPPEQLTPPLFLIGESDISGAFQNLKADLAIRNGNDEEVEVEIEILELQLPYLDNETLPALTTVTWNVTASDGLQNGQTYTIIGQARPLSGSNKLASDVVVMGTFMTPVVT